MVRSALVAVVSLVCTGAALGAPARIPLRGTLTDSAGTPVDGTVTATFSLYGDASGGSPFHTETQELSIDVGELDTALGVGAALDLGQLAARDDVWLGIRLGNDEELAPRLKLGTVPYAATAAQVPWTRVTGVPSLQARVTGVCGAGSAMTGVAADGTVTCGPVGTGGGSLEQLAFAGAGIAIQIDTISVIFGDRSGTATEGNDVRLLGYPEVPGGIPYTFEERWQTLPPGAHGDFLRGRPPEDGPPYWGPILAEDIPPESPYYIWNRESSEERQTASIAISGPIDTLGLVRAGDLEVGIGSTFHKIAYGVHEIGSVSDSDCDNITLGIEIDEINFEWTRTLPLATCAFSVEFNLGTGFTSVPYVFLTPRSGPGEHTWALTYHPVSGDRIRVTYWRADSPGSDWGADLVIQWLAFN